MAQLHEQLQNITANVQRLLNKLERLRADNQELRQENSTLRATLEEQGKKLEELENKNLNLQISKTFGKGEDGKALLKQKLDEFIKEIDKCIAQLQE